MSFREIAVTIRAVNRASHEFTRIQTDAEALSVRIKSLGSAIAGLGATGTAIGHIAHQFGILNAEQARVFNSAMMVITVLGMFVRTSWGVALAQKIYAATCWVAKAAQDALNISYATFLALTGVGIAAIVGAAIAIAHFASQMNAATASVQSFNEAVAEIPERSRSIRRAGEEEFYRRGVE
jgi:ABC-type multidrug transport system fused ATPase/permease subunit